MNRPSLRGRIRDAWHILRGHTDLYIDVFGLGMTAGQHAAYVTFQQSGTVVSPYADPATGAAR